MGLLDWANGVRGTPGLGAGLLGGDWSADASKNDDIRKALMAASFGMMSNIGQGNIWQGLGAAGQAGMGTFANAQDQRRKQGMQDWQFAQQQKDAGYQDQQRQRQQQMDALPGQFARPGGMPAFDATGGMETAPEAPNNTARPQGFDMPGYIEALRAIDPVRAIQLEASMAKQGPKYGHAAPGSVIFNESTGQIGASVPKVNEPTSGVQEYQFAVNQGYKGTFEQWDIARKQAGAQTVTMGSPVPFQFPDGTPGLVQPANRPGGKPEVMRIPGSGEPIRPFKEPSASTKEKIAENRVAINKIDNALTLVGDNPNALGMKNFLGDTIMQRADPGGVDVRAAVADIGSQKLHDRSGANVTVSEAPRLKPFIPLPTDTPQAAKTKLGRLRVEYQSMLSELEGGASVVSASAKRGATAADKSANMNKLSAAEQQELAKLRQMFPRGAQ